eukprot:scaffold127467_cov21-Phaeocystis_antarctica.AAC.1
MLRLIAASAKRGAWRGGSKQACATCSCCRVTRSYTYYGRTRSYLLWHLQLLQGHAQLRLVKVLEGAAVVQPCRGVGARTVDDLGAPGWGWG